MKVEKYEFPDGGDENGKKEPYETPSMTFVMIRYRSEDSSRFLYLGSLG